MALLKNNNTIKDRIGFKDGFSLFLLATQAGYFFDTNVEPLKDSPLQIEILARASTITSPDRRNDLYVMFSPNRATPEMLTVLAEWKHQPEMYNKGALSKG